MDVNETRTKSDQRRNATKRSMRAAEPRRGKWRRSEAEKAEKHATQIQIYRSIRACVESWSGTRQQFQRVAIGAAKARGIHGKNTGIGELKQMTQVTMKADDWACLPPQLCRAN
jgi:hypothetical protein